MQKYQKLMLDLILFVQLKLRISMYVNYVAVIVIKKTSQEWPRISVFFLYPDKAFFFVIKQIKNK